VLDTIGADVAGDTRLTDRFRARPDAEAIFTEFVANANTVARSERTLRAPRPRSAIDASAEIPIVAEAPAVVLLTKKKDRSEPPPPAAHAEPEPLGAPTPAIGVAPIVKLRDGTTARFETERVVPDVKSVTPPPPPLPEKSEDGQIPAGELDRTLTDMTALMRWGHVAQVEAELDVLLQRYPADLLLLRRITEFHIETQQKDAALECLFKLSTRLFERRNVIGMRAALEQVLVLDPGNKRAYKLLGLLEARPATEDGQR
jgi:hypothetical protein